MQISARNQLRGTVKKVVPGIVTAEVVLDVNGTEIVGVITKDSIEAMAIKEGDPLTAIIKSTSVMFMK